MWFLFCSVVVQSAPHPPQLLMSDSWTKPYSREYAAFPAAWLRGAKFWPTTCTCLLLCLQKIALCSTQFDTNLISILPCLCSYQVAWTMCMGIATSSALCNRDPKSQKKLQLLPHDDLPIITQICKTAPTSHNASCRREACSLLVQLLNLYIALWVVTAPDSLLSCHLLL